MPKSKVSKSHKKRQKQRATDKTQLTNRRRKAENAFIEKIREKFKQEKLKREIEEKGSIVTADNLKDFLKTKDEEE